MVTEDEIKEKLPVTLGTVAMAICWRTVLWKGSFEIMISSVITIVFMRGWKLIKGYMNACQ